MTRIAEEPLLAFHFGLSDFRRVGDIPRLPQAANAPAIDTQSILQLDALFTTTSIDDALQAMPDISDPNVLAPSIYTRALDDARHLLWQRAKNGAPEQEEMFLAALSVLEEEQEDRNVLQMARSALMQA